MGAYRRLNPLKQARRAYPLATISLHFRMGKKRKQLSHAEIWDDSALVQSWDEALAEYKVLQNTSLDVIYLLIRRSSITAYMRGV